MPVGPTDPAKETKQDSIQSDTDAIEIDTIAIQAETDKISTADGGGLGATEDSLAYGVGELDRHVHGRERWLSLLAPAGGRVTETGMTPFVAVSGNNAYGAAIKILDVNDTPQIAGMVKFDAHRLLILNVEHDTVYRMRISFSAADNQGDAIAAGDYSEVMFLYDATNPQIAAGLPVPIMMPRGDVGDYCWAEVWNATNSSEVDFFFGIHEYEG